MSELSTNLESALRSLFADAAHRTFGEATVFDAAVRPSKHADFQVNGALGLAKALGRAPRDVAQELSDALASNDIVQATEVAGPGFINVTISNTYLTRLVSAVDSDDHLGTPRPQESLRYVVDYAAPNIAKNMHVGHLRTSIIGDALVRMLTFAGHDVVRQDHQGDWGTQFGMLIEHLIDSGDPVATARAAVDDLDSMYKTARAKFDSDEAFATRARARVVALQRGDDETLELWHILVATSRQAFLKVYRQLGILLTEDDARGESFYNDMLQDTVDQLITKGLAKEDDGALCVYPDGFKGRDGEPFPFIIRKSDGGYNYATTDIATVRYSVDELEADRLVYVTDARQANHFHMVFEICREAGWLPTSVDATHVGYGMVLGPDNKPYKTRSGETVRLTVLLDEAVDRADQALSERTTDLTDEQRHDIAAAVGIGAVKWADLKNEHTGNYVFDIDRMVAFNGNTGPYVQYASTRAKSVLRRAGDAARNKDFSIIEPAERTLALQIAGFGGAVERAIEVCEPHHLTSYLYDLADAFSSFYEKCPVLSAEPSVRESRIALCALVARVLDQGLALLGIDSVDRM